MEKDRFDRQINATEAIAGREKEEEIARLEREKKDEIARLEREIKLQWNREGLHGFYFDLFKKSGILKRAFIL